MTGIRTLRVTHIHRKRFMGFLDVPYSSADTVAQLKTRIAAQTGLRVSHISYRGLFLSKSMSIAHLLPDSMRLEPPRLAAHTKTLTGKELLVRTLTGKLLVTFLPLSSTVRELKEEIRDLEDIPLDQQRLLFTGKLLEDDKKLVVYNVGPASIIDQITPTKHVGVQLYVDVADGTDLEAGPEKLEFSEFGPDWRVAAAGLNVEGECHNMVCVAYGKMVICNKGFSVCSFAAMESRCPMCERAFEPLTCAFTSCLWMYEGRTEAPIRSDVGSPWFEAGDQYELFHQVSSDAPLQWENLIITARKPIATRNVVVNRRRVVTPAECSICYEEFAINGALKAPSHAASAADCRHTFHLECVTLWKAGGGASCPMCRGSLLV